MKRLFLGIGVLLVVTSEAQQVATVQLAAYQGSGPAPLHNVSIGERMPDVPFAHILNYAKTTDRLSDFHSRLTILDFWNVHCAPCIAAFPNMQSLGEKFPGVLQVILVDGHSRESHDDSATIIKTIKRVEDNNAMTLTLPVVYDCPELDSCFEYTGIPHEVWLDGQGRVVAITYAEEVNEENIRLMLEGRKVNMHMKVEAPINWFEEMGTISLQEVIDREGMKNRPLYSSNFYKGLIEGPQGLHSGRPDSARPGRWLGMSIFNDALYDICKTAYSREFGLPDNQIVIQVKDSMAFVRGERPSGHDTFFYDNCWTYDLEAPSTSMEQELRLLQGDLQSYFGINMTSEERPMTCMVISAGEELRKSFSKGGDEMMAMGRSTRVHFIRNTPISNVIWALNNRSPMPLIDSTGVSTQAIDMNLPDNVFDFRALCDSLRAAGFVLSEERLTKKVALIKQD